MAQHPWVGRIPHGLEVNDRGRLPVTVLIQYLTRPEAVRAWARERDLDVPERGRVPAEVTARYLAWFGDLVPAVA